MDLQQIKYFLALSEELHFWNTSEKVAITQSALSRQIKSLEDELGVQLFERTKRNVKLTAAGAFLKDEWSRLTGEIESIHKHARELQEGRKGTIKIGYLGSIANSYLPDLLKKVANSYPDIKIELQEPIDISLESSLLNYQLDLCFRRQPAESNLIRSLKINKEHFALVVPEDHPITENNFKSLLQLQKEKFIISPLDHRTFYVESLQNIFHAYNFDPEVFIETDFGSTIMSLVSRGLGVSVIPESYAHANFPGVRFIRLPHETILYALWRKNDTGIVLKNILGLIDAEH